MKQLFVMMTMLLSASVLYAQDIITLRTGETINCKVAEVGVSEVKYYKSSNLLGPVYVTTKTEVSQIVYQNGSTDVFETIQQPTTVIVQQPTPRTIIVEQPYSSYRRRTVWNSVFRYPAFSAHIDFGHHYSSRHHGRHH